MLAEVSESKGKPTYLHSFIYNIKPKEHFGEEKPTLLFTYHFEEKKSNQKIFLFSS
jgi:hypothetical protein